MLLLLLPPTLDVDVDVDVFSFFLLFLLVVAFATSYFFALVLALIAAVWSGGVVCCNAHFGVLFECCYNLLWEAGRYVTGGGGNI